MSSPKQPDTLRNPPSYLSSLTARRWPGDGVLILLPDDADGETVVRETVRGVVTERRARMGEGERRDRDCLSDAPH